jgi:D-glycero-alpha-D-manno-heptose 1-phosphate guanylyltransferase
MFEKSSSGLRSSHRWTLEDQLQKENEDEMKEFAANQITAVILAGGFGKRVAHLLPDLPKPMAQVNGKPFLEWVVRYLAAQNIHRVVLSTGHRAAVIEQHFRSHPVTGVNVSWVPELQPLGTAGGFLNAIRQVKDPPAAWLVLNGDSLAAAPLDALIQPLADPEIAGAILGVPVAEASRYGTILQNANGELAGFNEKKPGAGVINAGVYLFRAPTIGPFGNSRPLSFESDVFPGLIVQGVRLKVCVTDAPFLDIGTPESLPLAEEFIRRNAACFR